MSAGDVGMTASFLPFCSCWLSLEGGLLYAFVGPAAVIVLVRPGREMAPGGHRFLLPSP